MAHGGRLARAARRAAAWYVATAAVLALPASIVDGVLVARADVPPRAAVVAGLAAGALGALAAVPVALALAAGAAALTPLWPRLRWPLVIRFALGAALAAWPAWHILDPPRRLMRDAYVLLVVAIAAVAGTAALLAAARPRALAAATAALLAIAAAAFDVWLATTMYFELHAIAHGVMAAAAIAAVSAWPPRLARMRGGRLAAAVVTIVVASAGTVAVADALDPGWRSASLRHGRHATRLVRALRALVDRDRDGYSPIAWGADCDDGDPARHPLAVDPPGGGDANCNGVDPPADPGPEAFGLARAAGAPAAKPGDIDLVVLLTVDTLRADAATAELMPNLVALGATGAWFPRAVAAGSATRISLPLIHRPADDAPAAAAILERAGIHTSAIRADGGDASGLGFGDVTYVNADAFAITDAAIERIRAAGRQPHMVWAHYIDPHAPYRMHPDDPPGARTDLPPAYQSEVRHVDRAIGRLVDFLRADSRLERAAIIVTADHGEGFGEQGYFGHTRSGYHVVLAVPAVFVAPGIAPGRYGQLVTHRDLPATLLGAFGLDAEARAAERFGRSWWRLRDAPTAPLHRFVVARSARFASGRERDEPLAILVRDDGWKLVASVEERLLELHHARDAPAREIDRIAEHPAVARELWRALALALDVDRWPRAD
ncbi:MAG: hypothetical protein D6689_11310 [Deltaproteobacteria bacterium]|nr:MAG: hypothetical protein D6689_11310 [Deltaproteobacteria bacterium]